MELMAGVGTGQLVTLLNGTVIYSGYDGSYLPQYAFNSNTSLSWAATPHPQWIGYVFDDPVDIGYVTLNCGGFRLSAPTAFTVDYSDDGDEWTVSDGFETTWPNYSETQGFELTPPPVTGKLLRHPGMEGGFHLIDGGLRG